jgi:hypothetical protein
MRTQNKIAEAILAMEAKWKNRSPFSGNYYICVDELQNAGFRRIDIIPVLQKIVSVTSQLSKTRPDKTGTQAKIVFGRHGGSTRLEFEDWATLKDALEWLLYKRQPQGQRASFVYKLPLDNFQVEMILPQDLRQDELDDLMTYVSGFNTTMETTEVRSPGDSEDLVSNQH